LVSVCYKSKDNSGILRFFCADALVSKGAVFVKGAIYKIKNALHFLGLVHVFIFGLLAKFTFCGSAVAGWGI